MGRTTLNAAHHAGELHWAPTRHMTRIRNRRVGSFEVISQKAVATQEQASRTIS
jgi:hypothetical protein